MARTKVRGRRKPPPRPLTPEQLRERDPWYDRRGHPVFEAIIKVLIEHPSVVYYHVDWRPWLFGPDCPKDEKMLKAGGQRPVRDPDPCCGSQGKLFTDGGGGYLERFAWQIVCTMAGWDYLKAINLVGSGRTRREAFDGSGPYKMKASEAVLAVLRHSYEWETPAIRYKRYPRRGLVKYEVKARWGFDRLMRECGINQRLLGLLDREVARQVTKFEETKTNPKQEEKQWGRTLRTRKTRSGKSGASASRARASTSCTSRSWTAAGSKARRGRTGNTSRSARVVRSGASSTAKRPTRSRPTSRAANR